MQVEITLDVPIINYSSNRPCGQHVTVGDIENGIHRNLTLRQQLADAGATYDQLEKIDDMRASTRKAAILKAIIPLAREQNKVFLHLGSYLKVASSSLHRLCACTAKP